MAARLNPRHSEMVRDKIKASQLINALQNHVLDGKELQPSQITAALGLLKKCVADLSAVEHSSDPDKPVVVVSMEEFGKTKAAWKAKFVSSGTQHPRT